MPINEPNSPAEMAAINADPQKAELLLQQRAEPHQRAALIINLLFQGRHDHARLIATEVEHHAAINVHEDAVKRADDDWCGCEHIPNEHQLLQHQVLGTSWDDTLGAFRVHYRCNYCGVTNATPQPPNAAHDIVAQHQKLNEQIMAERLKRGQSPAEIVQHLTPQTFVLEQLKAVYKKPDAPEKVQ